MKRLLLLMGLLLAIATPSLAQTKTDTIRFDFRFGKDYKEDSILLYQFSDKVIDHIEIEWISHNGTDIQRFKPGKNGFNPDENGYYRQSIQDSGWIHIYHSQEESNTDSYTIKILSIYSISTDINVCYYKYYSRYQKKFNSLIAKGTALTNLYCDHNLLTNIDISACPNLKSLNCDGNQLKNLDISNNTALTWLNCDNNQLTNLDISNNTALTGLDCSNNQLTNLDVKRHTALTWLDCSDNPLTSIDVSNNTALTELWCCGNQLTSLDVKNLTALEQLLCYDNQLTSLDVSTCTALTRLECGNSSYFNKGNLLTSLNVSNNTALTVLDCSHNQLSTIDVSNNTDLDYLYCNNNQLTSLDVSNNTELRLSYCDSNHIPLTMLYKAYSQRRNWVRFQAHGQTDTIIVHSNQLLDLSTERLLGKKESTFEISDASGQPLPSDTWTEKDFTFRFHKNGLYKLTLQNRFVSESEDAVTFIWYVSVVDEIPEGYFTVLVAPDNAEGGKVTGNGTYQEGKDATITAFPNKGYRFINWTKKDGSVFSTDSVHTFAATENLELTANFEQLPDDVANELHQTDNLRVYAQDRTIYLSENRGAVQVYNVAGQCVYSGSATVIPMQQGGVYIVRVGARSYKVLVR